MANISDLVQAIIDATNAAAAAVPPPVVRPFALLPGLQNLLPIDFQTEAGMKIFNKATTGMVEKFDLKEGKLRTFLNTVKDRVNIWNWVTITTVLDSSATPTARNLLTNFGQVTFDDLRTHSLLYAGTATRNAQNEAMMYYYLADSITEDAKLKAMGDEDQYSNVIADVRHYSGSMLLKIIIGKSSVDTKAKVLLLRTEISALPHKMIELKGDVMEFNLYVQMKRDDLLGRGPSVDEIIAHVFAAYLRVPDENFVRYIQSKKDQYEEDGNITTDELMSLALVKYELIKQQTAVDSEGDERIVALNTSLAPNNELGWIVSMEAKMQLMQDQLTKAQGKKKPWKKNDNHAWKKVKPKDGEPRVKVVSGRTYNWCRFHEAWTMHLEADCTLGNAQRQGATAPANAPTAAANHRAMLAMMMEEDEA